MTNTPHLYLKENILRTTDGAATESSTSCSAADVTMWLQAGNDQPTDGFLGKYLEDRNILQMGISEPQLIFSNKEYPLVKKKKEKKRENQRHSSSTARKSLKVGKALAIKSRHTKTALSMSS